MPRAPCADTEYFGGTFCGGSMISCSDGSEDEHSPSALRHSEVTAVESPPSHAIPEVGQRAKHLSEVPTAVRGEEAGYVLKEYPSRSKRLSDSGKLVEETGFVSVKAGSSSSDGEIGAGESSAEEANVPGPLVSLPVDMAHVRVDGHSRESVLKDSSAEGALLSEEEMSKPSSGESEVETSDSAEGASDIPAEGASDIHAATGSSMILARTHASTFS
jgi:hypothetical protein